MKYYLAVDIGASSGRHIVGYMQNGELMTEEVYRFPNNVTEKDGHLIWDVDSLFQNIKNGIREAFTRYPVIESVAIDTWGVDYVLLRTDEEVRPVYAYRDARTERTIPLVHEKAPFELLYSKTGIQFASFNTIYQLYDDLETGRLDGVTDFLMLPEYFSYKLTGQKKKEYTNATTTGMLNAHTKSFDPEIVERLGLPMDVLSKEISAPGTLVGRLLPEVREEVGGDLDVVLCASHDTASAVEGIPMDIDAPYISSGTWSLLGVKVADAITDERSLASNFSNEGGVGYIRYQKNIMGLWLVQSLRRELCPDKDFGTIAAESTASTYTPLVDVNDNIFFAPKSMKEAFDSYLTAHGHPAPACEADYFNCAYRSLADGYRVCLADLANNSGKTYDTLYIVGGGAKNTYLNELTEEIAGVRVVALPIEATALGNLKIQMNR